MQDLLVSRLLYVGFMIVSSVWCSGQTTFSWPEGKSMALSLTWDDGRASQVQVGIPILDQYGIKGTFYVIPAAVEKELEPWKAAVQMGHEIANHSVRHPCSGNFVWAREKALEEYTIPVMQGELMAATKQLKQLLDVDVTEFAYPCGQTFIGRGRETKSYVPLVASQFKSGRTWLDEAPNDPAYCDLAQLTGMEMDGKSFKHIRQLIEQTRTNGHWLVLAGHDINDKGRQTTQVKMLKKLLKYLTSVDGSDIWVAPVGDISSYVLEHRQQSGI